MKCFLLAVLLFFCTKVIPKTSLFIDKIVVKQAFQIEETDSVLTMETTKESKYLRVRLRFDKQALSVIHAKQVESPFLVESEISLGAGIIYELSLDNQRIDMRSIPYDGLFREFTTQSARNDFQKAPKTFDFFVRIPLRSFKYNDLQRLQIELYNLNEPFLNTSIGDQSILKQYPNKLEILAVLKGIKVASLNLSLQKMIATGFRE